MNFLTTKNIAAAIENIIKESEHSIFIISPYIKIDEYYLDILHEAEKRNVRITVLFGKTQISDEEKEKLLAFQKLDLFFLENLHAKCYINENSAIVTSMNFYDFSEKNNREMGIRIFKKENESLYNEIEKECRSMQQMAKRINRRFLSFGNFFTKFNNSNEATQDNSKQANRYSEGFCIRCKQRISLNPRYPLCENCFSIWAEFGNVDYPEQFCHRCSKQIFDASYSHPFCHNCEREYNQHS